MGQNSAVILAGVPEETMTCQPHAGQICLFPSSIPSKQGNTGKSWSSPNTASSSAVLLMLLAQVTVQGSDHTGLFPKRILIPQLSLISLFS